MKVGGLGVVPPTAVTAIVDESDAVVVAVVVTAEAVGCGAAGVRAADCESDMSARAAPCSGGEAYQRTKSAHLGAATASRSRVSLSSTNCVSLRVVLLACGRAAAASTLLLLRAATRAGPAWPPPTGTPLATPAPSCSLAYVTFDRTLSAECHNLRREGSPAPRFPAGAFPGDGLSVCMRKHEAGACRARPFLACGWPGLRSTLVVCAFRAPAQSGGADRPSPRARCPSRAPCHERSYPDGRHSIMRPSTNITYTRSSHFKRNARCAPIPYSLCSED
jgi:hypothetical protein